MKIYWHQAYILAIKAFLSLPYVVRSYVKNVRQGRWYHMVLQVCLNTSDPYYKPSLLKT